MPSVAEFLAGDPDKTCWAGDCPCLAVMLAWTWCPGHGWTLAAVCAGHPFEYVLAA